MNHQEQITPTQKQKTARVKKNKFLSKLAILASAVLFVVGVGYGLSTLFPQVGARDQISPAQAQQITREFSKLQTIDFSKVQPGDIENALDSMHLPSGQRRTLSQDLKSQNNNTELVWLILWDFATQDGDIVNVSSAGYSATIPLLKQPTRIAIPIDGSRQIIIQGNTDGGGGITLGVKNGNNPVQLPIIRPGETIHLTASISSGL